MFFLRPFGHRFVNRDDPDAPDFDKTTLTTDDSWNVASLAGIIPKRTKLVAIRCKVESSQYYPVISVRTCGNTNEINVAALRVPALNKDYHKTFLVVPDSNRRIEYKSIAATFTTLDFTVAGWWT